MGRSSAREKFLADMRQDGEPRLSPLSSHLHWLASQGPDGANAAEALYDDICKVFLTEEGLRVLKLLEKSVLFVGVPNGAPEGALREMNAVRNFVLDLRRIVSNGR